MTPKALSREIKFRAFYKEENCMFYSCEVLEWVIWEFSCGEIKVVVQELGTEEKEWNVKDLPIMQYTGLLDRNGKEIYEGDIVIGVGKTKDNKWQIKRKPKNVEWVSSKNGTGFNIVASPEDYADKTCMRTEIIGNIYENPDLLTKENK